MMGWIDKSSHKSAFISAHGVRINFLDWGGDGPPLVLIHGIGNSPHIFDDLAPLLRDRHRVVAYARRGHGQSDAPDGPYYLDTYVEDLRQLLDALDIPRASLLGWSMGGNEITRFAGLYPERTETLVYLEAGYDWSDPTFLPAFGEVCAALGPDAAALDSLDALRGWYQRAWLGDCPWTPALEAFLRDAVRIDATGKVHPVPNAEVFAKLFASLAAPPRDYSSVRAPALVLYADQFLPRQPDQALDATIREFERDFGAPFRQVSVERVRRELQGATIEPILGRTHMSIGVQDLAPLATTISQFLVNQAC